MKIAITGATGFIGQKTVEYAIANGHQVVALVRSKPLSQWQDQENISTRHLDLTQKEKIAEVIEGCECVVHLAATMDGSAENQYQSTLQSTKNLLEAMTQVNINKLIAISSISILDYVNKPAFSLINEQTPIQQDADALGTYALMKRDQEMLFIHWGEQENHAVTILRPGLVYDEKNLSTAHAGFVKGTKGLLSSHSGFVPLVHVDNVANAIVAALEACSQNDTIHLIDSELPTQSSYLNKLKEQNKLSTSLSIPWRLHSTLMGIFRVLIKTLKSPESVPDSFRENSVAARFKPFKYSNERAKEILDWQDKKIFN